jgi:hypothetical protein
MSDKKPPPPRWRINLGNIDLGDDKGPVPIAALSTDGARPGPVEFSVEVKARPLRPSPPGPTLPREKLAEIADRHGVELLELPATAKFHDGEQWQVWAAWWDGSDAFLLRGDGVIVRLENAWVSKVERDPPDGVEETGVIVTPFEFSFKPAGREKEGDR